MIDFGGRHLASSGGSSGPVGLGRRCLLGLTLWFELGKDVRLNRV
jgi:hypothetical protein